jgi:hypothetical protein
MELSAIVKTYGLGSGLEMTMQDDLYKKVWLAEYRFSHELYVKTYAEYTRKSKRHGWVRTGYAGSYDKRENTITEIPLPPVELRRIGILVWSSIQINTEKCVGVAPQLTGEEKSV